MGAVLNWLRRQIGEGAWRMAYGRSLESGALFEIPFGNGWERGLRLAAGPIDGRGVPAAFACVMSFARATSQATPAHKRINSSGKHEIVEGSPAARLLRYPNAYQTFDQFIFNIVGALGFDGETLALIVRDDRGAPAELHQVPRRAWQPYVAPESGAVFYYVGESASGLYPRRLELVPARDVIHFRQYTPRHPLVGETALAAAALATGINVALSSSQAAFFQNMARPAGILSTDQVLNRDQMTRLRAAFEEQAAGMSQGKLPILGNGLKFQALAISSVDAQLIESQRMSVEEIARVMGVPLPVIGVLQGATYNNVEQLINHWLAVSLGCVLETVERLLDRGFALPRNEYVELDTNALLRSDLAARIDALTKGIQGGLYAPDEARELEGLNPTPGGSMPFLQQQMTPLDKLGAIAEKAAAPTPAPIAAPRPTPEPANANQKTFDPSRAAELLRARLERRAHA
jgi:HK97 family phage portal protein